MCNGLMVSWLDSKFIKQSIQGGLPGGGGRVEPPLFWRSKTVIIMAELKCKLSVQVPRNYFFTALLVFLVKRFLIMF